MAEIDWPKYEFGFYPEYNRKYILDAFTRPKHDQLFSWLKTIGGAAFDNVLDLGCGTQEFFRFYKPQGQYVGLDECLVLAKENGDVHQVPGKKMELDSGKRILIQADYRRVFSGDAANGDADDVIKQFPENFSPTSFISLFSIENSPPVMTSAEAVATNYGIYRKLFETFPNIQWAVTSGFYYPSQKTTNPIVEGPGFKSFQTLEAPEVTATVSLTGGLFDETRFEFVATSEMFGDCVEIWKIFHRIPQGKKGVFF
eukprot:TRINITY_DN11933_c0_g1_i1.p1 TRINITY_DN11933_c0_g1~~TRINITY_DN11933_c0_g1_i1.p1  ORF type:complete len:272 (-),score=71.01 TRINITY_DN11933_c0_g1_i1:57-824(-)